MCGQQSPALEVKRAVCRIWESPTRVPSYKSTFPRRPPTANRPESNRHSSALTVYRLGTFLDVTSRQVPLRGSLLYKKKASNEPAVVKNLLGFRAVGFGFVENDFPIRPSTHDGF
jgi:hypothetical protein